MCDSNNEFMLFTKPLFKTSITYIIKYHKTMKSKETYCHGISYSTQYKKCMSYSNTDNWPSIDNTCNANTEVIHLYTVNTQVSTSTLWYTTFHIN